MTDRHGFEKVKIRASRNGAEPFFFRLSASLQREISSWFPLSRTSGTRGRETLEVACIEGTRGFGSSGNESSNCFVRL